jgi:nicotinamidase-related amidase
MNKALFVVDVQKFFENKKTKSIARKINNYIKENKGKYSLIVFTVFKNNPESPLWNIFGWEGCSIGKDIEIMDEISGLVEKSKIIFRNTYSLLKASGLKEKLKDYKIGQIDICGFDTDACVLATTYDLFDSGYKPVILERNCGFLLLTKWVQGVN